MAEFVVRMADERGRVVEQMEAGYSASEVRDRFAQAGYLVYWVRPRTLVRGGKVEIRRKKVSLEQFVIFNQQFVTLIHAGLPIVQALDLLGRRQRSVYFRSLLENVRDRVKSGELLSDAFDAQGAFPKIYSTTILAGEKSGNLEEVLTRYVAFQRMSLSFRKKLLASLIYPCLLVIGVIVLMSVLVTYVVPKFAALYKDLNQPLPGITEFTIALALNIKSYIPVILAVLVVGGFMLWRWSKTPKGGELLDRLRLKVPVYGSVWLRFQVAMFSRMLSTLLSGGLPLVQAMETASLSMQSRLLSRSIDHARQNVKEGQALAHSLEETKIFPELAVEMVEVGESTGALPGMLISVAEFFEEDVQNALAAAMALVEPAILIVMGLVVGFILISLYMPIFSIGANGALG
ncbi:MAG TPA: type II secretion system F family protein [candidate division Zixibacteria bacterium]|nr:type II secretion system F family protein [candidate division Zixibacteria bacterium]